MGVGRISNIMKMINAILTFLGDIGRSLFTIISTLYSAGKILAYGAVGFLYAVIRFAWDGITSVFEKFVELINGGQKMDATAFVNTLDAQFPGVKMWVDFIIEEAFDLTLFMQSLSFLAVIMISAIIYRVVKSYLPTVAT